MDSQNILFPKNSNDECMTPEYAVIPIVKHLKSYAELNGFTNKSRGYPLAVWCPFDEESSEFVKVLREAGFIVLWSHIGQGEDFFEHEPGLHWDIMISNPPYKGKRKVFERALSFGKPFALLMTLAWLNDSGPKKVFMEADKQLQLLMFDKRIHYYRNGVMDRKTTFSSAYYCCDFLSKDLILETLNVPK